MSNYKFTSLLSSEYRQLFKSYHSFDRHQSHLNRSSFHSAQKIQNYAQQHYLSNNHKQEFKSQNLSYDNIQNYQTANQQQTQSSYLKRKTFQAGYNRSQKCYAQTYELRNSYRKIDNQEIVDNIRNKYLKRTPYLPKQNSKQQPIKQSTENHLKFTFQVKKFHSNSQTQQIKASYINLNTLGDYQKNQLKLKASQFNKKRNELKLKVRVNNMDKINKKFEYLHYKPQIQDKENFKDTFQLLTIDKIALGERQLKNPLRQANLALKIHDSTISNTKTGKYFGSSNGQTKQFTKKSNHKRIQSINDEENIQTPNFQQAQSKKRQLDAFLVSRKLESFVQNNFIN